MNSDLIPLPMALPGKEYIIKHINNGKTHPQAFRGYGMIPGTKIKLLFSSPFKDPCAYEIMGTVLALRREDSDNIYISPVEPYLNI